jgi:hypothetical protein
MATHLFSSLAITTSINMTKIGKTLCVRTDSHSAYRRASFLESWIIQPDADQRFPHCATQASLPQLELSRLY